MSIREAVQKKLTFFADMSVKRREGGLWQNPFLLRNCKYLKKIGRKKYKGLSGHTCPFFSMDGSSKIVGVVQPKSLSLPGFFVS